jgi:hypothetical protein
MTSSSSSREDLSFHPVIHAGLLKFRAHAWGILQFHHQLMVEHLSKTEHLSKSPERDAHYEAMERLVGELTLEIRAVDAALGLGKPKTELQ